MQRLADSVRKAAKREAGVSSSVDVVDPSDENSEAFLPQTSWNDVPHISNRSESSPTVAVASLTDPVSTFMGSIFTPPESAVPRPVTTTLLGSLQDEAVQSTLLPRSRTKGESTFITTPEHLNELESLQHGNVGLSSASLITSPVFPASLRKNSSPPPPPPKSHEQQDRPSTSFQPNAAASSKGPSFSMSSKQRLLSATAARNSVALRDKAPASFAKEHHIMQEDQLAKDLAAKRRFALQQMSKNAIADEIADVIVGTGDVFNNNPFEIRKELPRTPEAPILALFSPDQSSSYEPVFSRTASAEKKLPAEVPPTASRAAVINSREDSESHLIASAQHSPLTSSRTQPSPAHQSAAAAYYAALLNPTPPRVTATAIDMASPLLKDYVHSHAAASSTPSVSKVNRSPVAFPPSPSRYAGDPFPLSPASQFQTSHFDREEPVKHSMTAWGSARGTPDAASDPNAHSNAPNSASSASSWLNRRENSQSDVSNLPSPDLVATGTTPWKACTCDLHIFNPQFSHSSTQPRPFPLL
jgi:hypothetical protein